MNKKNKILNQVFDYFIQSNDYNGIPITQLSKKTKIDYLTTISLLKELTKERLISNQKTRNPHIIRIGHFDTKHQLEILENAKNNITKILYNIGDIEMTMDTHLVCIYPSEKYLKTKRDTSKFSMKPFSKRLALGEAQLKPVFFNIEVLDKYFKDPRYSFEFEDYSGKISCNYDENEKPLLDKEEDQIFLKTFGLGVDENKERVAVVYLRYLSNLTAEHQIYWKSKEINNDCRIIKEYYVNTIEGNYSFSYSIFSAFIEEHRLVTHISKSIFSKSIFKKSFEDDKRPKEFTFFFLPTLENYHIFISLLDKMLSDNINYDFFKDEIELFEYVELQDKSLVERRRKGTLRLLEEWVKSNYNHPDKNIYIDIFKPLRKVRKERQSPAHKISNNHYDKSLNKKQTDLIKMVYKSLKILRMILQQHPRAKDIKIPEWLEENNIKVF